MFDLDGVIIDSESEYTRIWGMIAEEFPTGVSDFTTKIKGTTLENILEKYYPDATVRRQVENRLYEEEKRMVYGYCPGAYEFLVRLREINMPTALYTSSNQYKMRHLYSDRPDIKGFFDVIVTGDDVTKSKPDPQGYLLAAKKLGINPELCAVVEDSLQGVKAGRAAGSVVVGVSGTLPAETLAPWSDIVISNLSQL